jgi:hypothetical protein
MIDNTSKMANFSASVNKATVGNNETYRITTSSSITPHSIDVWINQNFFDRQIASYPSKSFYLSESGILSFASFYYTSESCITMSVNGSAKTLRIHNSSGSYVIDAVASSTNGLTNPLYLTLHDNYAYVLNENGGSFEVFRYYLLTSTVTRDTSPAGLNACSYIANQCLANSKFLFGIEGDCYLINGANTTGYYSIVVRINIQTGTTQQLFVTTEVPNKVAFAMDSRNAMYIADTNYIEKILPTFDGTYYNISIVKALNITYLQNITEIYMDPFDVLYVIQNDGSGSGTTVHRFFNTGPYYEPVQKGTVDQTSIIGATRVQYSPENQKLYLLNATNVTIYAYSPNFDSTFEYYESPANIVLHANLADGSQKSDRLTVLQQFVTNTYSQNRNPRYQESGSSSNGSSVTRSTRSEYLIDYNLYKDGNPVGNESNYLYTDVAYGSLPPFTCGDVKTDTSIFYGGYTHMCIGSLSNQIVFLLILMDGAYYFMNAVANVTPIDIKIDDQENIHLLRYSTGDNKYYISRYDRNLLPINTFEVESNPGLGLIPRTISVDNTFTQSIYVIYDTKVKKYTVSSGSFVTEASFGSGSVLNRISRIDFSQNYLYVSDNSFLGFYKYPLSLASVTQITLASPPSNITQFQLDIYNNFHIYDASLLYTYTNAGVLLKSFDTISISPISMHIHKHMYVSYLTEGSSYYQTRRGAENVSYYSTYFDVLNTETGTLNISSTVRYMDGSSQASSFPYRRHVYTVNTSSTNISASTNRIALNSTTDNNGNTILPERIRWWKDGVIKKESLRSYKKVVGINDIEDPISISVNDSGHLYVLNDNTYTVDVYDMNQFNNNNYPLVQSISLYNDEGNVRDLFVDTNRNIYVLFDSNDDDLYVCRKYDPTGQNILLTIGPFDSPYNIFVDSQSNIYITDRGNDEVYKYNSGGTELLRISFNNPRAVAVDSLFNIYISNDEEIYKYDFEGNPIGPSPYLSGFDYIRDLYIHPSTSSNDLFVCDSDTNRVYKYNSSGTEVWQINQLNRPRCVVTDASGNVYISNYADDAILKYNSTGTTLLNTFKNNPRSYSFTVDGSGNVYIVDNDSVLQYDNQLILVKISKIGIPGDYYINMILCDRANNLLYVSGYDYTLNQSVIYKLNTQLTYLTTYTFTYGSYFDITKISYSSATNRLFLLCVDSGALQVRVFDVATETVVDTISLPTYGFVDIVVNPLDNDTFYLLNIDFQQIERYRLSGPSYVSTTLFSYPNFSYMMSLGIDSTYLYIGTSYRGPNSNNIESNVATGANKIYKLTLASDAYTETFVYNAIRPESMEIYNSNVYVNEEDDFLRILQNNTLNVIASLQAQDYDDEIAADSSGNIYVKNSVTGDIVIKYNSTGSLLHKFDKTPNVDTFCIDGFGSDLYIATSTNLYQYDRSTIGTVVRIDKYNSSTALVGSITNSVVTNNEYTFINYPLRNIIRGMSCDATYLYVSMENGPILRFQKSTLQLDDTFQITDVTSPEYILYKNSSLYVLNDRYQVRKYQITSTSGTLQSVLNPGVSFSQFGVDTTGKIYIPYNDRIYVYENDLATIKSSVLSLDTDYLFLGPSNKIYVADQDGSVSVYDPSIPNTYSAFLDVTEDGEYEIEVEYYDYQYSEDYTVSGLVPIPDPETYIEYVERIDLEMIPYYLYDDVLEKNEANIIQLFKSNRSVVLKICNFYQKMKNAHENPRRLNTPFLYNPQWYTKIRFDESQPSVPYFVGFRDMYFFYLFYYNKQVSLNMFYLIDVAQRYYRTLLLAQRAVNYNQDASFYYRLDPSIKNNFQLLQYVNSFLIGTS